MRIRGRYWWHDAIRRDVRWAEMRLRGQHSRSRSGVPYRRRGVVNTRLRRGRGHVGMDTVRLKRRWRDRIVAMSVTLSHHWIVRSGILCRRGQWPWKIWSLGVSEKARCTITAGRVKPARDKPSHLGWREIGRATLYLVLACREMWRVVDATIVHGGDTRIDPRIIGIGDRLGCVVTLFSICEMIVWIPLFMIRDF
jgi:hypothetical protein